MKTDQKMQQEDCNSALRAEPASQQNTGSPTPATQVHYWMDRATRAEEAFVNAKYEAEKSELDAARYRWLCSNNFDRQGTAQVHTWVHTWEPHSQTGEPTEWKQRVRGGALDPIIDHEIQKGEQV